MADHYRVELGQAIKRRREELGLTQKDLAELTHYKEGQTVSRWERGENTPGDLEAVARALKWTLAELVAGIEPPDRRVARKFGRPVDSEQSQLDRIEANTKRILVLLTGEPSDAVEAADVAADAAPLSEAIESTATKARGRSATPLATRRPRRAS